MLTDESLHDFLQDGATGGIDIMSSDPMFGDTRPGFNLNISQSPITLTPNQRVLGSAPTVVRPKTQSRLKVADVAQQLASMQTDIDSRIIRMENETKRLQQQMTISSSANPQCGNTSQPLTPSRAGTLQAVTPASPRGPLLPDSNSLTLSALHELPGLVESVQSELAQLPLVGQAATRDRDTFYRQLVQDTVTQASGKLKIKSGMDLESQELVRQIVYWPHAFTSELAHTVKSKKSGSIPLEAFIFGAINILLLDDKDVPKAEKHSRLILMKHIFKLALLRGWPIARQLHNCVLQAIEVGSISWASSVEHLVQLIPSGVVNSLVEDKSGKGDSQEADRVINIICKSYNQGPSEGAECTFSKDGRTCSKIHVCLQCAKKGFCFRHPAFQCRRK